MRVGYSASACNLLRRHNFRYVSDLASQAPFLEGDIPPAAGTQFVSGKPEVLKGKNGQGAAISSNWRGATCRQRSLPGALHPLEARVLNPFTP